MRLTAPSSVDEMVAPFLRAEIDADRSSVGSYLAAHKWPESLVWDPDTTDLVDNGRRAELLAEHRGWLRNAFLFRGFPPDVAWHRAELDPADVGQVLGANVQTWRLLSGGTRRFADAAAAARTGHVSLDSDLVGAAGRACLVAARYTAREILEPPILVAPSSRSPIVALEGHTRLVAWLLADRLEPLPAIVGFSDHISDWRLF
jgi:hypothetical protein